MPPDSTPSPERCFAVYRGSDLVFVYLARPGAVRLTGNAQVTVLAKTCVTAHVVLPQFGDIVGLIEGAASPAALAGALETNGYTVQETPISAVSWAFAG